MTKMILTIAALATCLTRPPQLVAAAADEDAALDRFFQRYLDKALRQRPLDATRLGDHRFDALLDDVSPVARRASTEQARRALLDLPKVVAYGQLSRDAQIDYEIFRDDLTKGIWLDEAFRPFEDDPRVYGSYISDSTFFLLTQSTLPRETNIAHCLARMRQIPRVIAAAKAALRNPPPSILETAILQNRGAIEFYSGGILELLGDSPQREAVRSAATKLVAPLRDYQQFLEKELRPRASGDWRIGSERFAKKLQLELDAGLTSAQVVAAAETEFDRVQSEMYVVSRQLWSRYYPGRPLPPDDRDGRRSTIQKVLHAVGQEHGDGTGLVRDARDTVDRIKAFIREADFLRLPDPDRCQVVEMPEFRRGNSLAYLENAPPLDPDAPSLFAVSPPASDWPSERVRSLLEEYNRHMLQILTIHEAYPGHYVQLEYSNKARSLIRRVLQSGTFIEGWAVYGEQTMLDQGYGGGDLALRLTQLKFYLRAVVNAILDQRMHCTAMSDDDAMRLLTEDGYQSQEEARLKIVRAKQSSCQLSTYFVGRLAIYRLRQQIEREWGAAFDLGRFHEAVLSHGSVPVKYLPELVRQRLSEPR